jgi:hypothetical protein
MNKVLVKKETLTFGDCKVDARFFELRTLRGARRYTVEVIISSGDRIFLDDDSMTNLEARVNGYLPRALLAREILKKDYSSSVDA